MKEMYFLYGITAVSLIASIIVSRKKTLQALTIALRRFLNLLPRFAVMLLLVSIVLFFVSDKIITQYLGVENKYLGLLLASLLGSVTIMPGFIAFPLAGILLSKGVPYMVLAGFTTTLMMVGVLTYPVEKAFLGTKVTIIRNGISFLVALSIAIVVGIFFGEIF
ncbi:permease [Chloroflexota bacterium]